MNKLPRAYAVSSKNEQIVLNSSSGGVFFEIGAHFLNTLNGVVYGAVFENGEIFHKRIDCLENIMPLMKSKYVKSDLKNTFKECAEDLLNDRDVFFVALPCQIAGLVSFLDFKKISKKKLFTADLICHGAPEKKYWDAYLKEKYHNSSIRSIDFRYKKPSWQNFSFRVITNSKDVVLPFYEDEFCRAFMLNYTLGNSCYSCKFKGTNRKSDITIGDFWGIEKVQSDAFNKKGTSLIVVNSNKNIQALLGDINIVETNFEKAVAKNFAYNFSVNKPPKKEKFDLLFSKKGFLSAVKAIAPITLKEKLKKAIKRILKK